MRRKEHGFSRLRVYVNIDEIVFDITFIMMFVVLGYLSPSKTGMLIDSVNPWIVVLLLVFMGLLAPWYLGEIYCRYRDHAKSRPGYKPLSIIAMISGLVVSLTICLALPSYIAYTRDRDLFYSGYAGINVFLGPLALLLGWNFGTKYGDGRDTGRIISDGIFSFLVPVLGLLAPCLCLFLFILAMMEKSLSYAVMGLVLFAVFLALAKSKKRLDAFFSGETMRTYIFPIVICAMLMLSDEIIFDTIVAPMGKNPWTWLLAMVITGLLPMRIILLFCPPMKVVNFVIGAAAILFLFYRTFL